MDAKKTGALIAERRKALGLTQKELAGRLIVSDKAVSKWETGAGYPEVTMLPLLAETLGITVDELLAGEVRADAPAPEQAAPQPSDVQRAYAAEKLASADDKLLLGGIILLLPLVYWVQVFAYLSAYGLLVTMLCIALFCVCFGWHSKWRSRLTALCQTDTERSRRRCRLLGVLFGGISVAALLRSILGYCMLHGIYPYYGKIAAAGSRRFDVFIRNMRTYDYHSVEAVLIYLYPLLSVVLFSLLIVAAVLAYRRMEAGTRFHPGLCGVSTVLAWAVTAAMLVCRFRIIARLEQLDYGIPLFEIQTPLEEQSNQLFVRFAVVWAAVVLAVVLLAVLLRRCTGAGSGAAVLCMVMQMPLWYFAVASNYLMEVDVTASYTDLYARGTITLYPNEFAGTLLLSLLIWAICTLLSGVRRKPRPSVAAQ
ncbi:MAG: helix-turn-helix domain-containing protein [Agathobaculum sp.]